jgi:hypothetical protein
MRPLSMTTMVSGVADGGQPVAITKLVRPRRSRTAVRTHAAERVLV